MGIGDIGMGGTPVAGFNKLDWRSAAMGSRIRGGGGDGPGMNMPIEDFGKQYSLSDDLVRKLANAGYETVEALRFATISELKEDGFGMRHINQLKHAIKLWAPE